LKARPSRSSLGGGFRAQGRPRRGCHRSK
jgi:hypothetical protein